MAALWGIVAVFTGIVANALDALLTFLRVVRPPRG